MGRYKWREANCKHCGRTFDSSRSDAAFCGQNCRKAHSRKRETVDKTGQHLAASLVGYMRNLDDPDVSKVAMGWLFQIKASLKLEIVQPGGHTNEAE